MVLSRERIASDGSYHKIDYISLVEVLHGLSSEELSKQFKGSKKISQLRIQDLGMLPMHLMSRLLGANLDETFFKYLLSGLTLLHKLYSIAPHHPKLEKMLLDDACVLTQLIDLIFSTLTIVNNLTKENQCSSAAICLHSTIVASSLYLLRECVFGDWTDVAYILSIHPKADRFMEAVFVAVHVDIKLLQLILPVQVGGSSEIIKHHSQQCEASLQWIHALCQQKPFEDYLVKHKVLHGKDRMLSLLQCVLDLKISTSAEELNYVSATVSRLKSKVLSILLYLCEVDSISYLDEVAKTPESSKIVKAVALEVIELLKNLFSGRHLDGFPFLDSNMPKGLLQLNAMRITDILSDDTNFRSFITMHITDALTTLFLLQHDEFVSICCTPHLVLCEEDATLEYEPFMAAGWLLNSLSNLPVTGSLNPTFTHNMPQGSYTDQRTSLLVKIIGNLHCFAPDISADEEDMFLNSLLNRLQKNSKRSDGNSGKASYDVSKNICSLLTHAESLINDFLSKEDVQILRMFVTQLDKEITVAGYDLSNLAIRPRYQ